jgi:hypothetical protein
LVICRAGEAERRLDLPDAPDARDEAEPLEGRRAGDPVAQMQLQMVQSALNGQNPEA